MPRKGVRVVDEIHTKVRNGLSIEGDISADAGGRINGEVQANGCVLRYSYPCVSYGEIFRYRIQFINTGNYSCNIVGCLISGAEVQPVPGINSIEVDVHIVGIHSVWISGYSLQCAGGYGNILRCRSGWLHGDGHIHVHEETIVVHNDSVISWNHISNIVVAVLVRLCRVVYLKALSIQSDLCGNACLIVIPAAIIVDIYEHISRYAARGDDRVLLDEVVPFSISIGIVFLPPCLISGDIEVRAVQDVLF